jgi:hypothetical protein
MAWWKRFNPARSIASAKVKQFEEELEAVRKRRSLIEAHQNEYFNTLQDSGWPSLVQLLAQLEQAQDQLNILMKDGRYEAAAELAGLLLDETPEGERGVGQQMFPSSASLKCWRERADQLLLQVVQGLEDAAGEVQNLGVSRTRKRQGTLISVSMVKRLRNEGKSA